jgi:hypothetical protein
MLAELAGKVRGCGVMARRRGDCLFVISVVPGLLLS